MNMLVLALIFLPIAQGALILAIRGLRSVTRGHWIALLMIAIAATVMAMAGVDVTVPIAQTPWGSTVALTYGSPANWLVAMAYWTVVIVYLAPIWQPQADGPPTADGLAWCALGAIASGLLIDDLLARVVILDIVSVLVALLLLSSGTERLRPSAVWDYVLLHIGDIAFLLMVLLLVDLTGTFHISDALGQAAGLAGERLILVLNAGLLAIWVKLGLLPMSRWFHAACELPLVSRTLVLSAGPPLLGAYLLYRLQPLFKTASGAQGGMALVTGLSLVALAGVIRPNIRPIGRYLALHSIVGLLLLLGDRYDIYLLSFVPVRAGLCLVVPDRVIEMPQAARLNALRLPRGLGYMADTMARLDGALTELLRFLAQVPYHLGGWLRQTHTGKLRINILITVLALIPILLVMQFFSVEQVR